MARIYSMAWIPARRGWMKEYRGKKYAVSCRQLNAPETKEGSYQAANAWWAGKKAEIDRQNAPPAPGTPEAIAALLQAWAGQPIETPEDYYVALLDLMNYYQDKPLPAAVVQAALGPERVKALEEGVNNLLDGPRVPPYRSVKAQVERWVSTQHAQVAAGHMTPDQADNRRICLYHFRDWCGPAAVDTIDGQKLQNYYLHCLQKVQERNEDPAHKAGWSSDYARKVFGTARGFVRFLWESGLVEFPKNINRKWRFGNGAKAVKTWTPAEVQQVIKEAPGKLKLALLLMANCGFTQADVSDLGDEEVDWQSGRITRKRSKTGEWENVPVVCYKLWPQTFELLKKYRSGTERVLLTESGKAYVRKELVSGKLVKADNIASNYTHLKKRLKFRKPLKLLRKTAATLLESHPNYGRFTSFFLGHAPQSVKDRHYAQPSQELFDEAVTWLGQQLGLC
jgi:integrase